MEGVERGTQQAAQPQAAAPGGSPPVASPGGRQALPSLYARGVLQLGAAAAPGQALPQAAGGKSPRVPTPLQLIPAFDLY